VTTVAETTKHIN